jgi:hypothetical protein
MFHDATAYGGGASLLRVLRGERVCLQWRLPPFFSGRGRVRAPKTPLTRRPQGPRRCWFAFREPGRTASKSRRDDRRVNLPEQYRHSPVRVAFFTKMIFFLCPAFAETYVALRTEPGVRSRLHRSATDVTAPEIPVAGIADRRAAHASGPIRPMTPHCPVPASMYPVHRSTSPAKYLRAGIRPGKSVEDQESL